MGITFARAQAALNTAVQQLFENPTTRSVGIGAHGDGYGFHVIRNTSQIAALAAQVAIPGRKLSTAAMINNVPISAFDRDSDIVPHVKLPFDGPGSPGTASLVPEQLL